MAVLALSLYKMAGLDSPAENSKAPPRHQCTIPILISHTTTRKYERKKLDDAPGHNNNYYSRKEKRQSEEMKQRKCPQCCI